MRPTHRRRRGRFRSLQAAVGTLGILSLGAAALVGVPATAARAASTTSGAPTSATDETKVPHYFGPWPNWANSPLTLPNADVSFVDPSGTGTGAAATATVGPDGAISSIDVTSPGHDYSTGTTVTIKGGNGDATATANVVSSGSVIGYAVTAGGNGYSSFKVDVTNGGGSGAAATASGGVDVVHWTDGGSGYTMPTVDFDLPDDPNGTRATGHVPMKANGDSIDGMDANGTITAVVVDNPGSGYSSAPGVSIHNGTLMDPVPFSNNGQEGSFSSTLQLLSLTPAVTDTGTSVGSGYTSTPDVTVSDPTGSGTGATATARTDNGAIKSITVDAGGSGYLTVGMKKFQDQLPLPCDPGTDGTGCPAVDPTTVATSGPIEPTTKFLPLGVPQSVTYTNNGVDQQADQYEIGLVQYRTRFSSDLPATLVRGYVQLSTAAVPGQKVPLYNELLDGTRVPITYTDATGATVPAFGVTTPQWLGPIISAKKNRPVRVIFRNLLPTGKDGNLFLPVDSTMMGAGMGPMSGMPAPSNNGTVLDGVRNPACTYLDASGAKSSMCYTDNRATLHLHGGITPWISDGTPHQWITPAGESTSYPQGVDVSNVPDMAAAGCDAKDDGCETFYYTNQQSARFMFYHDHSYGITRLNVYAGEAAGYQITDAVEQGLVSSGTIPGADSTIPLIVQDRTFVPADTQLKDQKDSSGKTTSYGQDPTWDTARWGTKGSFWYHHVYMPAQNPSDPSGMSAYGRWMYGPWFWPTASDTKNGPIANPYYDPTCNLDDPKTWQYQTDPYCEPKEIPGTPNISAGMEQFNDTPIVNGMAYPTVTLQPKTYRFKMLNAANDRFFNFQWYTADPTYGTEVTLKQSELDAAQTDPTVFPTPVGSNNNAYGPDWIQIANEGGFLPAPAVIDGQQPTTWITDPTRFDYGNVDKHSLVLAPAERADVIVDFSKFAGKTLILYNDAPAAYPARVPSYDYYTGAPDMSPVGAPKILPGYGPNTRTVMQVKIAADTPATPFDLTKLQNAFKHSSKGTGVFESGQNPVIVGQAAYNSAYGTSFAGASNCNVAAKPTNTCDGIVRVNDSVTFGFNTLKSPTTKTQLHVEPKAIHDEMNATTFDEYGRMQANLGVEAQPATPGAQNVTLYPYINPATELVDGTNLPVETGTESNDVKITPLSSAADGTQIWRITHNGVDTHPIHFHLYDVQVLNRVTWDNIVIPPDANELGWKDTVRMSPLEDTIIALRPVIPSTPFEVPNAVRPLDPTMPLGSTAGFSSIDPQGAGTAAITNQLVNFGWEYVWHCHILSHEEMDMMRPQSLVLPPRKPGTPTYTVTTSGRGRNARTDLVLTWADNSITETSFQVQRSTDGGTTWTAVGTVAEPLVNNQHGTATYTVTGINTAAQTLYRVAALNTAGYGNGFPTMTAQSVSDALAVGPPSAPAPVTATGTLTPPATVTVSWTPAAGPAATSYVVQRDTTKAFNRPTSFTATGTSYADAVPNATTTYFYRVQAVNPFGSSPWSSTVAASATLGVIITPAPTALTATFTPSATTSTVTLTWTRGAAYTSQTLQRATDAAFTTGVTTLPVAATASTYTDNLTLAQTNRTYYYRLFGTANGVDSVYATTSVATTMPPVPSAPTVSVGSVTTSTVPLTITPTGTVPAARYTVQWSTSALFLQPSSASTTSTSYTVTGLRSRTTYYIRVAALNDLGVASSWSAPVTARTV